MSSNEIDYRFSFKAFLEEANKAKEESLRIKERDEKSKEKLAELKNSNREYRYNRERRNYELDRLVYCMHAPKLLKIDPLEDLFPHCPLL
jgi:hypothetical protein